jgi:phage baseplate assembly protein gpV
VDIDDLEDLADVLVAIMDRLTDLERRRDRDGMGHVHAVDLDAGTVVIAFPGEEEDAPELSPAVRFAALGKTVWSPPTMGEQCALLHVGDEPIALVGFSDTVGSPGNRDVITGALDYDREADDLALAGGSNGRIAMSELVRTALTDLKSAIGAAAVSAGAPDSGAAFKANLIAELADWPGDLASEKVSAT